MKNDVLMANAREGNSWKPLIWFITWLLLLSLLRAMPAMAYRGDRMMEPDQVIANLRDRLDLTEEQMDQIRPIIEDQIEKRRQIFEEIKTQGRQGRKALKNEMRAIRSYTDNQLEGILTEQQMEEYRQMQDERRQQKRGGRSRQFD